MACGSCHIPGNGGSDPRSFEGESVHPGLDARFGTPDDIRGSKGGVMQRYTGGTIDDGTLYPERQVRSRRSMTVINADFSPEVFWDGRARGPFIDPETDTVAIPVGGALEIQALGPILSTVEMSHEGRVWGDVTTKLAAATPLALATDLPTDVRNALNNDPTYSELFQSAFGTPDVTEDDLGCASAVGNS